MTKIQAIKDLIKLGATTPEIVQKTGAKYSYVANVKWKLKHPAKGTQGSEKTTISQPQSKDLKDLLKIREKEVAETTEPLTIEPIPQVTPEISPIGIAQAQEVKQALSAKNIKALFSAINGLLPNKYQRPEEQMELLGEVWEAPLNRIMEKYIDQNSDVYVAIVITIIVFAPAPIQMFANRKQKPKVEQTEKTETK